MQFLPQNNLLSDSSLSSFASATPKRSTSYSQKRSSLDSSLGTASTAPMVDLSEISNSTTSITKSVVSILRSSTSNRSINKASLHMIPNVSNRSISSKVSWHPQLEFDNKEEEYNDWFAYDNDDELVTYDERMEFWEDDNDDDVFAKQQSNNEKKKIASFIAVDVVSNDDSASEDILLGDPAAYLRQYKANLK